MFDKSRPAILQLSGKNEAYIVDLVGLANNQELDSALSAIFTHPGTVCIGFAIENDLDMFRQGLPKMSFHQKIANLIDLMDYRQPFWKHVQTKNPSDEETKEPKGLAGLV